MKKPELMSPAADWTSLRAAVEAGCDSVYFGIKQLNMRITAKNFEQSELKKIVDFCHKNKVKAYLTLNVIVYDNELEKLKSIISDAKKAKIDAVICWDFAVVELCNKNKIPVHISTQASISNFDSAYSYYKNFKAERVVLARELSLEQIKKISGLIKKHKLKLDIECFVHGAMCVSVSGRCFISQHLFNKSANRGDCLQPCRRNYTIHDPEENHDLVLGENYVLSPKDLCAIEIIDKLIDTGISVFKIEGRNRSPEYVKVVTICYRKAIDYCFLNCKNKDFDNGWRKLKKQLLIDLATVYNRGFSTGFFLGKPANEWTDSYGSKAKKSKVYIGKVINFYQKVSVAEIRIEAESLNVGDTLMIQGPTTAVKDQLVVSMQLNHKSIVNAKKGQRVAVKTDFLVRQNDKVFVIRDSKE